MKNKKAKNTFSYKGNSEYWNKIKPRVVGDIRQRPESVKLLGKIKGKTILDAGCGTGYISRIAAKKGAIVYGCDTEVKMLKIAQELEVKIPLGIKYEKGNIFDLSFYGSKKFDAILCVGVLLHYPVEKWKIFFQSAKKILKKEGTIIVSVEHPFLSTKLSPIRISEKCWTIHKPLSTKTMDKSQPFKEYYYDIDGNVFESIIWYNPIMKMLNCIIDSGLKIEKVNEVFFKKEDILSKHWGNDFDFPAFIQFKLSKSK